MTHITDPTSLQGKVDYVWNWNTGGAAGLPSVYKGFYYPYDRDDSTNWDAKAHTITWWKANHPDWIEYRCDRTTVAYEFGDTSYVPLDITNPAVLQYLQQTYYAPTLSSGTYQAIAFDNPDFDNSGSWTGQRCGHYAANSSWVQQFSGTSSDPAYRQAILTWAQTMRDWMHAQFPKSTFNVNFSYDNTWPTDSDVLLSAIDIDLDESGFTNGNSGHPGAYTDGTWYALAIHLQKYLAQGKGWFDLNREPVSDFSSVTNAQVQWALANYLLVKNNASFVFVAGPQYGYLQLRAEFAAPVGSPTESFHQSQGVYVRGFTGGVAFVNPSSTTSYTVMLSGVHHDLYGNAVSGSVTLAPASGLVLLNG
jgi:hypothetical protein